DSEATCPERRCNAQTIHGSLCFASRRTADVGIFRAVFGGSGERRGRGGRQGRPAGAAAARRRVAVIAESPPRARFWERSRAVRGKARQAPDLTYCVSSGRAVGRRTAGRTPVGPFSSYCHVQQCE